MKKEIDARGLSCPQPVVLTRNEMKEYGHIEILVDNETACENLKRLASASGWSYEMSQLDGDFSIILKGTTGSLPDTKQVETTCSTGNYSVALTSDKMGKGDDDLGAILMKAFMNTLASGDTPPVKLVLYNSGVKLAAEGSGVTDDLVSLHSKGTEILICGTCVNYFSIGDKIITGTISNMFDILETLKNSGKIINP